MNLKSLFSWFASGPKAAERVLDGAISGIDKLIFTEEEKSEVRTKLADQWLELQKLLGEETTTRSVSRRIIALLFVVPFVLLNVSAAVIYAFNEAYARFMFEVADGQFGVLTLTVAGFYFGPYMLQRLVGSYKNGNGHKNGNGG
jgi:hypothetical protein